MRTAILNCRKKCWLLISGFYVETHCKGPIPGWNQTRNQTGNLDPLLTLTTLLWYAYNFFPEYYTLCCIQRYSWIHLIACSQAGSQDVLKYTPEYNLTSAKCKSVRKPPANLPDTLVHLTSASKCSRCPEAPLELCNVLSDSERACSGAPERTCSYGGAFKMLRDLTYRILKFWNSWDFDRRLRPRCSSAGDLLPYSHIGGS